MKRFTIFISLLTLIVGFSTFMVPAKKADAASGWTDLSVSRGNLSNHYSWARACKTSVNSIYGPLHKITYHVYRKSNNNNVIQAEVLRNVSNGGVFSVPATVSQNQWLFGVVAGLDIYASALLDDQVQFSASNNNNSPTNMQLVGDALYRPSQIANCN